MKVLVVDHNGILAVDRGLYRELAAMPEVSLTLLVPEKWSELYGTMHSDPEMGQLDVYSSRTLFSGRSHRAMYLSLGRMMKMLQPDILYVVAEPESYLAWQAVKFRDKVSAHSLVVTDTWRNIDYGDTGFPYKLAWLNARVERSVLARANHCVAHNASAKEILGKKGFQGVTVIPPSVDTHLFIGAEGQRPRAGSRAFTIGYVGRFIPEKGVDVLLNAAARLPFDYRLLLIGDGPAAKQWRELAEELGIASRVEWKWAVGHQSMPGLFRDIDVLVLPSRTGVTWKEQFGRVLLEAMASGVPVIGSTSGEIPKVIGEAGIVFLEGNIDALTLGLTKIHNDENLRSDLVRKGLECVRREFSVSVIAPQYHHLFDRLLRQRSQNA